jgi:hypothetical protein
MRSKLSDKHKQNWRNQYSLYQDTPHVCAACDSTTTYMKDGHPIWRIYDNDWLCVNCYMKYVWGPVYRQNTDTKKYRDRWNPINNKSNIPRMIKFKTRRILLKIRPRKGICELCGAIRGIDCKRTSMHHKKYHDEDPLKDTIELCNSCHLKQHIVFKSFY